MKFKTFLIVIAVLVVFCGASFAWAGASDSSLVDTRHTISDIQAATEEVKEQHAEEAHQAALSAANVESDRVSADKKALENCLRTACTWSSSAEYEVARDVVQDQYGLSADSSFLTDYLAPEMTYSTGQTTGGADAKASSLDSQGLNMSFKDADIRVISAKDGVYSYFIQLTTESTYKDSKADSTSTFIAQTTSAGEIGDIEGTSNSDN